MTQSKVSILVPIFNAQAWLADTIESALKQSYQNIELVLVNDGSTDNSVQIAQSYTDSRVLFVDQPNSGASSARNNAIKHSSGELLQFLDADDLLAEDKIEQQVSMLQKSNDPDAVASGRWARFYTDPKEADFSLQEVNKKLWCDSSPIDWLLEAWRVNGMMHPAAWLVPKSVAQKAGGWNESLTLNDDGEYFARVLENCSKVLFCTEARSYYRSGNQGSLSQTITPSSCPSLFESIELTSAVILRQRDDAHSRQVCADAFQLFVYTVYPLRPDLVQKALQRTSELGGSDLQPPGGPKFRLVQKLFGWKVAKRLQRGLQSLKVEL